MSETWLNDDNSAILSALTPESHVLHHVPRPDKEGGGVDDEKTACKKFQVFRVYGSSINKWEKKIILNVIYKPPHGNFSLFLQEIGSLILESEINEADVIYLEDFNIMVDDIRSNDARNFLSLLNNFSLVNLINKPTYNSGHSLDLDTTKNHHSLVKSLTVDTINTWYDHKNVIFHLNFSYAKVEKKISSGSEKITLVF